jgi:hypothetical protein
MQVTWWELEELLDVFRSYPSDHFEQLAPNMWLRSGSREGPPVPWYGIAIVPPRAHKYGCATLKTSLIDTSHPNIDLEWLVLKFTSYNIRTRITEALVEELKCDQRTAQLMGIGLSYIALVSPEPSGESEAIPEPFDMEALVDSQRLLPTLGGGWTRLRRVGPGLAQATVSCRSHDRTGFSPHLVGILRPVDGRPETLDGLFPPHDAAGQGMDTDDERPPSPQLPFQEEVTHEPSNVSDGTCLPSMLAPIRSDGSDGARSESSTDDGIQGQVPDHV